MIADGLIAACGLTSVSCTSAEFGQTVNIIGQVIKTVCPNDPDVNTLVDGMLMLSAMVCAVWKESEVQERAAYATSAQYVAANQRQLNTRLAQAREANRELSQKKGKVSAKDKKKAKDAIKKNVKLIDKDLERARQAQKEAKGEELDALRQQINALSNEKRQLQKNSDSLSALSSI